MSCNSVVKSSSTIISLLENRVQESLAWNRLIERVPSEKQLAWISALFDAHGLTPADVVDKIKAVANLLPS